MTMKHGLIDQGDKFRKRVASQDTSTYKVVKRGQLVVGFPIDEGVLAIQDKYDEAIVSPAYEIWDVSDPERIDRGYLERFLRSPKALAYYSAKLQGTTARRRSLPKDVFLALSVPVLDVPRQRQAVRALDQADALRARRSAAISLLDELSRSVFLETFGDLKRNPKGWETVQLGEVVRFHAGASLPEGVAYTGQQGGYLLLKVSDMNLPGNEHEISTSRSWSTGPGGKSATCPAGTIVIPKRGGAISTNKKRITVRPAILDPNLMGIVPDAAALNLTYLRQWFSFFDLSALVSGSSVPQLNKQDLAPLVIQVPPLDLQLEYVQKIREISRVTAVHRKQAAILDELFFSIRQRAFTERSA
ncbi:restriction endonuclease subunit S [Streptomyces sp. NPDC051104]|uniref:restriction endonuclease subunit S n=1 Tax=Streptomyces sp. NPDC051104 TaxID=3155044 RepID=UPI00343ABB87